MFTLAFAAASVLVCLLLYNSGQLANTKTQLQNAADAGAYSAGLMLARDHNFSAYTNRAMVANHVAVAQLVSLKSYFDDAASTHARLRSSLASYEKLATAKPFWNFGKSLPIESVASNYSAMAGSAVKSLDLLVYAFETSQQLHHQTTALNVLVVANEVVKKNDPKAGITSGAFRVGHTAYQLIKWDQQYSKRYRANDTSAPADRFADVVLNKSSSDDFSRSRASNPVPAWLSTPTALACPLGKPLLTLFGFEHRGGTLLSSNKKRWLALDATYGGGAVFCTYPTPWGPVVVMYPLLDALGGSGGALAGADGGYDERTGYRGNAVESRYYGGATSNATTIIPGRRRYTKGPGTSLDTKGGLQTYYRDVQATATPVNQSAVLNGGQAALTIEVEHRSAEIRGAGKILDGGAVNINMDDRMKGDTMRTLSAAHAYFYRPNADSGAFTKIGWRRADGRNEVANLFNPYWQARLVEPSESAKTLSIGAQ